MKLMKMLLAVGFTASLLVPNLARAIIISIAEHDIATGGITVQTTNPTNLDVSNYRQYIRQPGVDTQGLVEISFDFIPSEDSPTSVPQQGYNFLSDDTDCVTDFGSPPCVDAWLDLQLLTDLPEVGRSTFSLEFRTASLSGPFPGLPGSSECPPGNEVCDIVAVSPYNEFSDFHPDIIVRIAAVPEPATLALMGLGLAGISLGKRRRMKSV